MALNNTIESSNLTPLSSPGSPCPTTSTQEFTKRENADSTFLSRTTEMQIGEEPQEVSTYNPTPESIPDSHPSLSQPPTRKRFSVDAFKRNFSFKGRKSSQTAHGASQVRVEAGETQESKETIAELQHQRSVNGHDQKLSGLEGTQVHESSSSQSEDQEVTTSEKSKESELYQIPTAGEQESPIIPDRSTSSLHKQSRIRSSSFSSPASKPILAFKFPSFNPHKSFAHSKRSSSSPYSNQRHSVSVPALVTSTSHGPSRQELARSSGLPIRRVSFSPSTDEALEAREEALAHLEQARKESTDELISNWDKEDRKKLLKEEKERRRVEKKEKQSQGGEGREGHKSKEGTVSTSSDKVFDGKSAAAKDSQFTWDQDGIHSPKDRRRRPSKAKVNRRQAIAARHARILEHVINGGTGLSSREPIPAYSISGNQSPKKNKSKDEKKSSTIPLATSQELNQLKKALMDANVANGIIGELRAMKLPVQASGLKEHGERVLSGQEPMISTERETEESAATLSSSPTTAPFDPFSLHRIHRSHSEAELALRKVGSRDAEAQAQIEEETIIKPGESVDVPSVSTYRPRLHFGNFRIRTGSNASAALPSSSSADDTATAKMEADSHAIPGPLRACALSHADSEAHHRHQHSAREIQKLKLRHEDAIKASREGAAKEEVAAAAAVGIGGVGLWSWWNSKPKTASKESLKTLAEVSPRVDFSNAKKEAQQKGLVSANAAQSFAHLPQIPDLGYGVSPISLIMSPSSTAITASATASGAFDMMASVSGAAIRASGTDLMVQPPLDRLAVFVHWWGFEITIPKASMKYLSTAQSVSGAFMSFLQTMCVSGGVPELLPFIKYISMYMDVEFKAIQQQDKGSGVVVAATWFMPLALVPRPWDYSLDPSPAPAPVPSAAPADPSTSKGRESDPIPNEILIPPAPVTSMLVPLLLSSKAQVLSPSTPLLSRTPSTSSSSSFRSDSSPARSFSGPTPSPPRTPTPSQILAVANAQKEGALPLGNLEDLMMDKGRKRSKISLEILEELPEGSVRIKA